MRKRFLQFLAVAFAFLLVLKTCYVEESVDIATFNIENFPKSERQIDGAFDAIAALEPEVVAVQEIRRPTQFGHEARSRLGAEWHDIWPEESPRHHVGVMFDSEVFEFLSTETHDGTVVCGGCKPALEVRLRRRGGDGPPLSVVAVHLKAYDEGLDIRRKQYRALRALLGDLARRGDRIALVGDFNSTRPEDRDLIGQLAHTFDLRWTTRRLACTSYWKPDDECLGSTLDHMLVGGAPPTAVGRGPCEHVGCEPGHACPTFVHHISDHCPISLTLPP